MPVQTDPRYPTEIPPSVGETTNRSASGRSVRNGAEMAAHMHHVIDHDRGAARDVHFLDYVRVLHKRRWTAGTVFAVIVSSVTIYLLTATPIYQATARLLIEAEKQNIVSFKEVVEQSQSSDVYYQTQFQMLGNRALAAKTLDTLGLWDHPEFGGSRRIPSSAIRTAVSNTFRAMTSAASLVFGHASSRTDVPAGAETLQQSKAIDAYLQRLIVSQVRNSRLVDVGFRSPDAALAAKIANAHARGGIWQNLEFKFQASKEASDWLGAQLAEQRERVEKSEIAVQQYREQNDAVSLEEQQTVVTQKLADVSATVTRARTARIEKEALYRQLEPIEHNQNALDAFPAILSNTFIQQLKSQLAELQRQDAQLAEQMGERHPDRIRVATALQVTQAKLRTEVENVVQSVRNDYLAAEAQEQGLMAALEAQKREALAMNRKGIDGSVLRRDADSNRQIYESLLQRAKETGVSSELKTTNIRLVDPARVPRDPVSPNRALLVPVALVGGALLAVGLAFFFEYLDDRIRTPDEIETHLGLATLGFIPRVAPDLQGAHFLLDNGVPPNFLEAFGTLRTSVLFSAAYAASAADTGTCTIVVTSATPGEGKTVTSSNLAMGIAQAGQRVLLIDTDMRRPRVHEVFDIEREPGLSNILVGEAHTTDVMHPSSVPELWVLPAGHTPPNPSELLGSQRFQDVLSALAEHFDWIVMDSPPVLAVTDAAVVARGASGVLFVVGAGKTGRQVAQRAVEQLERAQATVVGAVLNDVDLKRHSYYYGPYGHRGYASYYTKTS